MGYHRVGFEVVGVDIKPQPHYPFEFHQADALNYPLNGFDVYHASPPCQGYTICQNFTKREYPKLLSDIRELLKRTSKPYVIENVMGAKSAMINPLMLCGTMFGLKVIRHRLFECNPPIYFLPASCGHEFKTAHQGHAPVGNQYHCITGHCSGAAKGRLAMGIDWMTMGELSLAIPPAYTEYIGKYLLKEAIKEGGRGLILPRGIKGVSWASQEPLIDYFLYSPVDGPALPGNFLQLNRG